MPNLAWTWTTLIAALQAWPRATSQAFIDSLPTIVGLGERRLWRDLNLEEYDKTDETISTAIGNRLVAKPADVIQLRTVGVLTAGSFGFLELRSYEFCRIYSPLVSAQGAPLYYAELNATQIYVVPTPQAVLSMSYRYVAPPSETLSSSAPNTATWLSRAVPDALFVACMMEAEAYLKADDRYGDFQSRYYQELIPVARLELRGSMRSGDYQPLRPAAAVAG